MNNGTISPLTSLSLAAWLLLVGQLLYVVVTLFHAGGVANDHPAIFATYAGSSIWTVVHLGQFICMATMLGGLFALFFALDGQVGMASWLGRFGAALTVVTLALYGAVLAVDGVALKRAVNAWASAPDAENAARFASAEFDPLARVGDEELPKRRDGPRGDSVRGRSRTDNLAPAADWLRDGPLRPRLSGPGLDGRLRGLLTNAPDGNRVDRGPERCVDALAGCRRLADAGFGLRWPNR